MIGALDHCDDCSTAPCSWTVVVWFVMPLLDWVVDVAVILNEERPALLSEFMISSIPVVVVVLVPVDDSSVVLCTSFASSPFVIRLARDDVFPTNEDLLRWGFDASSDFSSAADVMNCGLEVSPSAVVSS